MEERMSERQQEYLRFLNTFEAMNGCAPTFKEVALGMGVTSKGSVSAMVNMLSSMGFVDKAQGTPRGTRSRSPVQA